MRGGRGECPTSNRCGVQGPLIQFPFRLKSQPHHCGYPGFVLSCTENNQIMLELPDSVKLLVKNIIYKSREIIVQNPDNCLERQLRNLSLASSPFQFKFEGDVTFFNCSSLKRQNHLLLTSSLAFLSLVTQFMPLTPSILSKIWTYRLAAGFTTLQLDIMSLRIIHSMEVRFL
uniref:RING-type E3 ubiquitin transferase n=1 Tax=Vitis vinifera TaxID=29760 RepID=F6HWF5_VITVI